MTKLAVFGTLCIHLLISVCAFAQDVLFVHHSVGRNLISEGDMRAHVSCNLWSQDYNHIGLTGPDGESTGRSYIIPDNNTYPNGLYNLFTRSSAAKDSILSYDVVLIKSCYPAADMHDDDTIDAYKFWYSGIAAEMANHPDVKLILLGFPPRHRLATDADNAARARAIHDWIPSLVNGSNIFLFSLFDNFANADNVLRYEYERSHSSTDSHPNAYANSIVGPDLAAFINEVCALNTGIPANKNTTWGKIKREFKR